MALLIRFLFVSLLAVCSHAFSVAPSARTVVQKSLASSSLTVRHMFSSENNDDTSKEKSDSAVSLPKAEPLKAMTDETDAAAATSTAEDDDEALKPKAVYRDLNTGEMKEVAWVDPDMAANANPLAGISWAYAFLLYPLILLLNDAFHFIDPDGPFGFVYNKVM